MSNPFEQYYHRALGHERRGSRKRSHIAQSEKDAPMVLRGAEKAIAEDSEQLRRYNRVKKEELKALLLGPHGQCARNLLTVLKELTPESADTLFRVLGRVEWLRETDHNTRMLVLGLIDDAIIRMRVRNGMSPIDDSLPGEPPTVFEICRANLNREERGMTNEVQHDRS